MHISRRTNQELVVVDSSIWISVVLLCACLPLVYQAMIQAKPKEFLLVGLLLLFAFLFWRRETVTFDAGRQQVRWSRRRAFKVVEGAIPFSEIKGIAIDSQSAGTNGGLTYRLSLLTAGSAVPMSDIYAGNWSKYEKVRGQILDFLHIEADERSSPGLADEEAIRLLLQQGRKVDAVQRLRSCQKISLAEARDRVNAIDEKMKAAQ